MSFAVVWKCGGAGVKVAQCVLTVHTQNVQQKDARGLLGELGGGGGGRNKNRKTFKCFFWCSLMTAKQSHSQMLFLC